MLKKISKLKEFEKNSLITLSLSILTGAFGYLYHIILGNIMSAAQYGIANILITLSSFGVIFMMPLCTMTGRKIAMLKSQGKEEELNSFIYYMVRLLFYVCLAVSIFSFFFILKQPEYNKKLWILTGFVIFSNILYYKREIKEIFSDSGWCILFFCKSAYAEKEQYQNGFWHHWICAVSYDRYDSAGTVDRHYFLQDIYVAKKIISDDPQKHYDIGSRLDGFCAHLLCNDIPLTMIDVRPLTIEIERMTFIQSDATNLEDIDSESIHSLSSLHAIEHFGLGRYGDSIGAEKCFLALKAMQRVLKKGGKLYLSVPVSNRNGIIYNSHRVFKPATILKTLDKLTLAEFAYIQDYKIYSLLGERVKQKIMENSIALGDYDLGIFIMQKD